MSKVANVRLFVFCLAAGVGVVACGDDADTGTPNPSDGAPGDGDTGDGDTGDTGDGDDGAAGPVVGDASLGSLIAQQQACASCHGADYAGVGSYPNITSDQATGIGSWTDAEIGDSVTKGVGPDGANLCTQMPRVKLDEERLAHVIAFLRSLPAVSKERTEACTF